MFSRNDQVFIQQTKSKNINLTFHGKLQIIKLQLLYRSSQALKMHQCVILGHFDFIWNPEAISFAPLLTVLYKSEGYKTEISLQ